MICKVDAQSFDFMLCLVVTVFCIGGSDNIQFYNDVWKQADRESEWQSLGSAPWGLRESFSAATYNDQIWVMGGLNGLSGPLQGQALNDIWNYEPSSNKWSLFKHEGINSGHAPWLVRGFFKSAVFLDRLWIIGGVGNDGHIINDIWSFTNYTSQWKQEESGVWSNRQKFAAATFGPQQFWIMGEISSSVKDLSGLACVC